LPVGGLLRPPSSACCSAGRRAVWGGVGSIVRRVGGGDPGGVGQAREQVEHALAEPAAQVGKVEVGVLDVDPQIGRQAALPVAQKVDRRRHREVGAHGRIERQKDAFGGFGEAGLVADHPVEDRLAVLGLADLQERRLARRLDEVAGGIDLEQPVPAALDLASEQEAGGGIAVRLDVLAVVLQDLAQHAADHARGIEHGARGPEVVLAGLLGQALGQKGHHRLGGREVARRQERHDALARLLEQGQLAHGRDLVNARVGARVRRHHQPVSGQYPDAVGHDARIRLSRSDADRIRPYPRRVAKGLRHRQRSAARDPAPGPGSVLYLADTVVDRTMAMAYTLAETLQILKMHEPELRRRGVTHAAVFGSVARGEAGQASDVDILIDLDPSKPIGLFGYAAIKLYVAGLFGVDSLEGPIDIVSRANLKPRLRSNILRDEVGAF
jgi:uncharacterized protein